MRAGSRRENRVKSLFVAGRTVRQTAVMRRFRLKSLRAGVAAFGAEIEVRPGERELLHPLFVVLRDKRALLYAPHGREDTEYVTRSIESIREELTTSLKGLDPASGVVPLLEMLRRACREYLDIVAANRGARVADADFSAALGDLRKALREVAEDIADLYALPTARELANEMRQADEELPLGSADELPQVADEAPEPPPPAPDTAVPTASSPLIEALSDPDSMVRFNAMTALGDHLRPDLVPVIEPLLKDPTTTSAATRSSTTPRSLGLADCEREDGG
jgi:hypothetical protein